MQNIDVYSILPDVTINFSEYWKSEDSVLTPGLLAAGYSGIGLWYTTERDSFGPLGRAVIAENPDGVRVVVSYG